MTLASTTSNEMARPPTLDRADLVGLALVAAAVIWTFVAATSGGDPWPTVGMFVLVALVYTFGRMVTPAVPFLVPALVVAVAVVLGVLSLAGALPEGADAAPLGYVNARSAFYVEAAAAAVMLAVLLRGRGAKIAWLGAAVVLAFVPLFSRAEAASFVVVLLLLPAAAIALEGRRLAVSVGLSALLFMATLAATSLVAAAPESTPSRVVAEVVGKRRVALWNDGLDLMLHEPLTGVGPGRFAAEAATAQTDRDARWAHHGFLQQGAETGLIGLAILATLFLWGFWRVALAGPSGMAVMGAFALTGLGILACSDYVFHFPLVTGATAGLIGAAVGSTGSHPRARPSGWGAGRTEVKLDGGLRSSPLQAFFQWRAKRRLSVSGQHPATHNLRGRRTITVEGNG